jgi:hypothetical protein
MLYSAYIPVEFAGPFRVVFICFPSAALLVRLNDFFRLHGWFSLQGVFFQLHASTNDLSHESAVESDLVTPVAVLFSGGLDSMILAALADEYIDPNCKHLLLILISIRSVSTSLLQNGMMSTLFCPTLLYLS